MEISTMSTTCFSLSAKSTKQALIPPRRVSVRCSLSSNSVSPFGGESIKNNFSGQSFRSQPLNPASFSSSSRGKRDVVTMVIPFHVRGPRSQPAPDLASALFRERIVYLGLPLVPAVTELMLAEFLYLDYSSRWRPIYFYINSTGTTKDGEKLGYETEAFAIYDAMSCVRAPVHTLCVGNAWGEASLLLAAGKKGKRYALPSSTIMFKEPISQIEGQVSDVEIESLELKATKAVLVKLLARHTGQRRRKVHDDMKRPKYFNPTEAIEYGLIDKVLFSEKSSTAQGMKASSDVVEDLKRKNLI